MKKREEEIWRGGGGVGMERTRIGEHKRGNRGTGKESSGKEKREEGIK